MKRTTLIALAGLALAGNAHAASFDCTKAQSKVEHLVCDNPELSKLDDDLNAAYSNVLKNDGSATSIRTEQKKWLKERNACLDAACLSSSYSQQIAFLKSPALAPFTFTRNETLPEQADTSVCKDFKNYLNRPRSNELFKPDGTLVRESDLFKSVLWEALDKEQYRSSFTANLEGSHPNLDPTSQIVTELPRRYASADWVLQRTLAYPSEYPTKPEQKQRWIYRLVNLQPNTRIMTNPKSKVELPTWFNFDDVAYLGYDDGSPLVGNTHGLGRATPRQWVTYSGITYAVINRTSGGEAGAIPFYLTVEIDELNVDQSNQSFMHYTCAFRAKNSQ